MSTLTKLAQGFILMSDGDNWPDGQPRFVAIDRTIYYATCLRDAYVFETYDAASDAKDAYCQEIYPVTRDSKGNLHWR